MRPSHSCADLDLCVKADRTVPRSPDKSLPFGRDFQERIHVLLWLGTYTHPD